MQFSVSQDFRPQTAASLQEISRARRERAIHPVTRRGLLRSIKTNPLNLEFLANEFFQIKAARDHVAPRRSRRSIMCVQRSAELFENIERKESDLSLVIVFKIEVTICANPAACDTFDHGYFDHGMVIWLPTVMANEIVSWRNVQVTDFHRLQQYLKSSLMKEVPSIGPGRIIRRRQDGSLEYLRDDLTIEEPLEILIGGKALATTMRTPGHDEELAAGFLVSEAIVHDRSAIEGISRDDDNKVIVDLASDVKLKLKSAQRFGTISSSCGLCGKTSIDAIRQSFPAIESTNVRMDIETLLSLPEKLQKAQGDFARTGGIHAAGIFDSGGELKTVREDIGRHNAVDKVVGRAFLDGLLPLNRHVLLVSGRASFEIVQKALAAGIPIVAAVSAPSTLAADFARESNQTLIGFLRPPSFNVYSHIERIILEAL
jgi:FdhD protein